LKLVLLGAPGAGKGTQAAQLSSYLGIPHISTGDALRKAMADKTETGRLATPYMEQGLFVPDELVMTILQERLSQDDCANGYILDGVPRTVAQAEALEKLNIGVDKVINLIVEEGMLLERLSGRRVCPKCGASFHIVNNPSAKGEICDKCGERLVIRSDDNPETIRQRLVDYHVKTEPLIDFYRQRGLLVNVEGRESIEDTSENTRKAIGV